MSLGVWLDEENTTTREDVAHVWPWVVCGLVVLVLGFVGAFLS
jgi:hypothetical protein